MEQGWSAGARPAVRLVWRCDTCGNDDGGKWSRAAACPSSSTVRHVPKREVRVVASRATRQQRCHAMGRSGYVGARRASFSCKTRPRSRSCLVLDADGRLFGFGRHGPRVSFVRRGLDESSAAKSKSLARGEMMTMTLQATSAVSSPQRCVWVLWVLGQPRCPFCWACCNGFRPDFRYLTGQPSSIFLMNRALTDRVSK